MITEVMDTYAIGALFALLAAISFAFWNIYLQRALEQGYEVRVALLTFNIAAAGVFTPVALWAGLQGSLPQVRPEGVGYFAVAGLMTAAVGPYLATQATRRIGAARNTSIRLLDPFFAFLIAWMVLGERLTGQVAAGVALIVGALLILQLDRRGANGNGAHSPGMGIALAVTASIAFSVGTSLRKVGLGLIPSPLLATALEGLVGLAVAYPLFLFSRSTMRLRDLLSARATHLWISALGGAGGMVCLSFALQRLQVPVAVALRNTSPWFALLLVPVVLGGAWRPTRWLLLSTVLLTGGMLLIVFR